MRLLVCAGMTGGGMYPALAVLQTLENKTDSVLWVGSRSGMEETLLSQYKVPYNSIAAAGVHGIDLKRMPNNMIQLFKGWQESKKIIRDFKPDVIFYTGGYVGVPMSIAARKVPSVVFIPDIEPGLALKVITRSVQAIAVSTAQSSQFFSDSRKVHVTGYPIRNEIGNWTRKASRDHFNIPASAKVLFVYGGSKGARSINQALLPNLGNLLNDMHVIHITGEDNWASVQSDLKKLELSKSANYHVYPFLYDDMGAAFSAADLAVSRAGASTIGELPYFGLPAILVPYPHAWRYQYQNASYLEKQGGAKIIEDENLSDDLCKTIIEIISNENMLTTMKNDMRKISVQGASQAIADLILDASRAENGPGGKI